MGAPLSAFMSVCTPTACQSTTAGPDGAFAITGIQLVDFGLRSHDDSTYTPALGTVVRLMHPTETGVFLEAGTLFVPSMPAGATLAAQKKMPQTVLAGDGLSLTFIAQDLVFQVGDPTTAISAHRIPVDHIPAYDVGSETIVAVYAIMPYSITSKSPVAIKAPIALPAGTEVRFRSVYEFEGRLSPPVVGHAAKDGLSVSTDDGTGIDNLTWLLITR
jgi:hypothetical protein